MPFGKGEVLKVQIHDGHGNTYMITSKDIESWFIYKDDKKLGKGHNPYELEDKYVKFAEVKDIGEDAEANKYKDDISVTAFEMQQHENERRKAMGLSYNEDFVANVSANSVVGTHTNVDANTDNGTMDNMSVDSDENSDNSGKNINADAGANNPNESSSIATTHTARTAKQSTQTKQTAKEKTASKESITNKDKNKQSQSSVQGVESLLDD